MAKNKKKNPTLADLLEAEADKLLAKVEQNENNDTNNDTIQDSSLINVSTTSVEQNTTKENEMLENTETNETENTETNATTNVATVESKETVSKKKLILDFIAANPSLESKNKTIAEALQKQGHDIKETHVAAVKSQEKKKNETPAPKGFDMSSFKQVFAMQKKLNEAGGIPAVELALTTLEPLLIEAGSLDNLKLIISTLKEVENM